MSVDEHKIDKIDIHTHIIPHSWPDWNKEFNSSGYLTIKHDPADSDKATLLNDDGSVFRQINRNCWCPEARIAECDKTGVGIQVLSTVPGIGFNYGKPREEALRVAQYLNNHISEVVKNYPRRFLGLGTVPLQDTQKAIEELRRCVVNLSLCGIQIGSHVDGRTLDDPIFFEFWEEVQRLQCAVFVHPWDMGMEPRLQKFWFPWLLGMPHETSIAIASMVMGGTFSRFPNIKVCFAHGGGCFPYILGRISHGFHARPDLCQGACCIDPKYFLGKFWVDSLVHDQDTLEFLIKKVGTTRIILGSDYPFPLGEIDRPGALIEGHPSLSPETKNRLLLLNAKEFLNIE